MHMCRSATRGIEHAHSCILRGALTDHYHLWAFRRQVEESANLCDMAGRIVTPGDFLDTSESEPEDLVQSNDEFNDNEQTVSDDIVQNSISSPRLQSTPNSSTIGDVSASVNSSATEGSFMTLLRETNTLVKSFDQRLQNLEKKVEELKPSQGSVQSGSTISQSVKGGKNIDITDDIRVTHCSLYAFS